MLGEDLKIFPWLKDIDKNIIHDYSEPYNHEFSLLREELLITHKTYRKEIESLRTLINFKEDTIKGLIDRIVFMDVQKNKTNDDLNELNLKYRLLVSSREEWIGRSLKFHFLFQEIDKIGLQQSEYILDAFKDIEVPIDEIPIQIRERYVPTLLTNTVELEFSSDSD